jgi:Transmembrane domain of unknown function (DUF3566)
VTAAQGPDARRDVLGASTTRPLRAGSTPSGPSARPGGSAPVPGTPGQGTPAAGRSVASGTTPRTAGSDPGPRRPVPRPATARVDEPSVRASSGGKARRARLALKRIDPWSVFVFSLIAALLLGIALVAAVAALYAVLDSLGVQSSVNELFAEVVGDGSGPLITGRRVIGGAAVLAALNVVLLTLLATLGALLYNLCASFTGGLELTLGERDA